MKLTVRKKESYTVCRNYWYEEEIDIDDKLLEQIENGDHPEYDSLEEWADDQDIDYENVVDEEEPYSELDESEIESVSYDREAAE